MPEDEVIHLEVCLCVFQLVLLIFFPDMIDFLISTLNLNSTVTKAEDTKLQRQRLVIFMKQVNQFESRKNY